jgi:hypothetical protein
LNKSLFKKWLILSIYLYIVEDQWGNYLLTPQKIYH